jgi:hypothetical protein
MGDNEELLERIARLEYLLELRTVERNFFAKELREQRKETRKNRSWVKHFKHFLRMHRQQLGFEDFIENPTHEELLMWYDRLQRFFARRGDKLRW